MWCAVRVVIECQNILIRYLIVYDALVLRIIPVRFCLLGCHELVVILRVRIANTVVGEQVVAAFIGNVDDVLEPAGFVIVAAWLEEVEYLWELGTEWRRSRSSSDSVQVSQLILSARFSVNRVICSDVFQQRQVSETGTAGRVCAIACG